MSAVATKEHKKLASKLKSTLATYSDAEDLINIGAYKAGSNPEIDYAIQKNSAINSKDCTMVFIYNIRFSTRFNSLLLIHHF